MIAFPIAKVNLGLNVVEKRPDGYHNLETVFYPVEGDEQRNLVVRAYQLLKADFPTLPRIHTHLWKGIPTQAGMGGGSSDCAYMIRLLNESFQLNLTDEQMIAYAARLGADCAFFIKCTPCYAEGIGERMTPICLDLTGWHIGIVRPDIPVSTKEAFSHIHPHYPERNCREVVSQAVETWRDELTNDFEESVFALHPEIGAVKERLYDMGATYAAMSSSGGSSLYRPAEHGAPAAESALPVWHNVPVQTRSATCQHVPAR